MIDPLLRVDDLHVRPAVADAFDATGEILEGLDLVVGSGEFHAILGPDGSGTSTLGATLMGAPHAAVTAGSITFRGDDITQWPVDERAKAGMFLTFQNPQAIAGVSVIQFLGQALSARPGVDLSAAELRLAATAWTERLGIESSFVDRPLHEGFSDSEKQRLEIMQMAILEPELAILDETHSEPDIDELRTVAKGIRAIRDERPSMGVVLITDDVTQDRTQDRTHDRRLLDEFAPDHVHILMGGRIVASGGMELAGQLRRRGYDSFLAGAAV